MSASILSDGYRSAGPDGYLVHLATDTVILAVFLSIILLLLGLLIHLQQLRTKLSIAETTLEYREETARFVANNLPGTASFQLESSPTGRFVFRYISEGFTKILGMDRERVLRDAKLIFDHLYEEDIPVLQEAYQRARKTLEPIGIDFRMLDIDGHLTWLQLSAVPHAENDVIVWDGILRDISDIKKRETALSKEKQTFEQLFETLDDLLLVCDMNGNLLHSNPAAEKRLEYTSEELKTLNLVELYPEHLRAEVEQVLARMQSESPITFGLPLQAKSGASIPLEMKLSRGCREDRDALVGIARAATLHPTETALRESHRMLRLIMDTIPMSVCWKNRYSKYLGCNKAFIKRCGLDDADDIIGKKPHDLFDAELAASLDALDRQVLATNKMQVSILPPHPRADGTAEQHEASKIPLHSETGKAVGVLEIWRDITEQNQSKERLKRTLEDMERFNELMRGRERRTLELKTEINQLLTELGREAKYNTTSDDLT